MQRSQVASPKKSVLDFGDETLDLSKIDLSKIDWSQVKWPSDMSRLGRLNWNNANWTTVDLSHTSGTDGEFSSFWHISGSPLAWDIKDYPQWNAMCKTLLYEFDHEHFRKIPSELAMLYGLASESALCDVTSRSYLANDDPGDCRSVEIKKRQTSEIHKEIEIWTLDSLLKVLGQYIALHLFRSRYVDSGEWLDIILLQNTLIDAFVTQLANEFINPIAEAYKRPAFYVDQHKMERFKNSLHEEVSKLLYMLHHGRQDAVLRYAVAGNRKQFFEQYQLQKKIDELKVEAEAAAKAAAEATAKAAAETAVKTTVDAAKSAQTVETVEAVETAAISVTETEAASATISTSSSSLSLLPASTAVPDLVTEPSVDSTPTDSRPRFKRSFATVALLALGAVAGVVALGIVIAATHGVALPFIAGVGTTILVGNGGAAAGLAVGCSIFGSAAAVVGAGVTYAAKKAYDLMNWFFCSQNPAAKTNTSPLSTANPSIKHSSSTTSLLHESMPPRDYDAIPEAVVPHVLPDSIDRSDTRAQSHGRTWASMFCCARGVSQQPSVVSVSQYQQTPGLQP